MSETIEQSWEEELLAEGGLRICKENLRALLEERFGTLPPALAARIETERDLKRLQSAVRQAVHIQKPEALDL